MDLSAALWNHVPVEILDQVLSFLPVPNLRRYRTVCKRWDQLICDPEFGTLCAQNASKRDASFIAMQYSWSCEPSCEPCGWCFLDLNARRWYAVKDDDQEIRHRLFEGVVGMDGGLICQCLDDTCTILVYNPIAKLLKALPPVPKLLTSEYYPTLTRIIDTVSQNFKVFLLYHSFDAEVLNGPNATQELRLSILNDPIMRLYDSSTNKA